MGDGMFCVRGVAGNVLHFAGGSSDGADLSFGVSGLEARAVIFVVGDGAFGCGDCGGVDIG